MTLHLSTFHQQLFYYYTYIFFGVIGRLLWLLLLKFSLIGTRSWFSVLLRLVLRSVGICLLSFHFPEKLRGGRALRVQSQSFVQESFGLIAHHLFYMYLLPLGSLHFQAPIWLPEYIWQSLQL
jgi:hypothetical protein